MATPYVSLADERLGVNRVGKGLSLAELPDALDEAVTVGGYSDEVRAATLASTNALRRLIRDFGTEAGRSDEDPCNISDDLEAAS